MVIKSKIVTTGCKKWMLTEGDACLLHVTKKRCASLQNQHLCRDLKDERDALCAWTGSEEQDCKGRKSVCVHTVCVKALVGKS